MTATLCPKCGSGAPITTGNGVELTLPRGWPMNDFCPECRDAGTVAMREFGRQVAETHQRMVLDAIRGRQ